MSPWLEKLHDYYWYGPNPPLTVTLSYKISYKNLHIMRITFFILQLFITSHSFWLAGAFIRPLKYLTIWGCLFCTFYFSIVSIIGSFPSPDHNKPRKVRNWIWKLAHILFEVNVALQFNICIFFWGVILPLKPELLNQNFHFLISNILLHGATPLFIWIELYYNHIKVYRRHAWWVVKVMVIYGGVNAYNALNYGPVYPLITWIDTVSYVLSVFSLGLTMFGFYIGHKLSQRKEEKVSLKGFNDSQYKDK